MSESGDPNWQHHNRYCGKQQYSHNCLGGGGMFLCLFALWHILTYDLSIRAENRGVLPDWGAGGHQTHSLPGCLGFDLRYDDVSTGKIFGLASALSCVWDTSRVRWQTEWKGRRAQQHLGSSNKNLKKEIKILCAIPNYQMVVSNWYAIVTLLGKDPNTCAASRLRRPIRRTFTFEWRLSRQLLIKWQIKTK